MKTMITIVLKDDEYVIPHTEMNVNNLLRADYNRRTPILLENEEKGLIVIISSEVESFFTSKEEDSKECGLSSKTTKWEDNIGKYKKELQGIMDKTFPVTPKDWL